MHSGHRAEEVEGGTEEIKAHFFKKEFKRQCEKNSLFVKMVCPLRNEGSGFIYYDILLIRLYHHEMEDTDASRARKSLFSSLRRHLESAVDAVDFLFSFGPLTLGAESQPSPPVFSICSVLGTMLGLFMGHFT